MDLYEKRRELFFRNLLLLGFDVSCAEKKYNVTCHRDMFLVPNKKAFEVVTHFFFTKLSSVCSEPFPIVWPLLEKSAEHDFRKTCFSHLNRIAKDDSSTVCFPRIFQTLFLSPGGERFYELYLAFSSYVMLKIIQKNKVCKYLYRPASKNSEEAIEILQHSTIIATNEFVNTQQYSLSYEDKLQKITEYLVNCYRKLKQHILHYQKQVEEKSLTLFACSNLNENNMSHAEKFQALYEKSSRLLYEVTYACHHLDGLLSSDEKLWEKIETELNCDCIAKVVLDGKKYNIQVPEILRTKCEKEFVKKGVQSVSEKGKLSFASFLDLCYICLNYCQQELERVSFPISCKLQGLDEQTIQKLEQNLKSIQCCRQMIIMEVVPNLTEILEKLRTAVLPKFSNSLEKVTPLHCLTNFTAVPSHSSKIPSQQDLTLLTPGGSLKLPFQPKLYGGFTNSLVADVDMKAWSMPVENQRQLNPCSIFMPSALESDTTGIQKPVFDLKNLCVSDILFLNHQRSADVRSCIELLDNSQDSTESIKNPPKSHLKSEPCLSASEVFVDTQMNDSGLQQAFSHDSCDSTKLVTGEPQFENVDSGLFGSELFEQAKSDASPKYSFWQEDEELIDDMVLSPIPSF